MSLYSSVAPSHRPDSSRLHGGESGAALRVEIANGDPRRMAAAQALVRRRYAETGLGTHALPVAAGDEGMTLLVWQGECLVGTLTLRFDGPGGLGADEQYRNQLEALRGQGARLCEAVRLAFEPSFGTPRNLAKLFETAFEAATLAAKKFAKAPDNDALLGLYSLYKQSTSGDVTGERPGALDMVNRAKYDAWAARRGMTRTDAMQAYVALVDELGAAT